MSDKDLKTKDKFNKKLNKPSTFSEIKIIMEGEMSRATLFRYLKKFLKSGDLIYFTNKKIHPKKFPTKVYLKNNLKNAKKSTKFKNN